MGTKQVIEFSATETQFLNDNEVCRLATVSANNIPHVTPICYIFMDNLFYFATDYSTKKYKNLKQNGIVALVIDHYDPRKGKKKAIVIQGTIEIIERGKTFKRLYNIFYPKFEWVRVDPWTEGEAPFVSVTPFHKASKGFATAAT